jgi:hypothetical protein
MFRVILDPTLCINDNRILKLNKLKIMDVEKQKVFDIIEKVKVIMENNRPRDGRGYTEEEIKFITQTNVPNFDEALYNKQLQVVNFTQIGAYAVAHSSELEAVLYNMLYKA